MHASKDMIFGHKKKPPNYIVRGPKANNMMMRMFLKAGRQVHPGPIKPGPSVSGDEASHGPTSFMVASGVWSDVKSPEGRKADDNIPSGWRERADMRLSVLRAKMEKESQRIIEYLDLKKMNETLEDIKEL